MEHCVLEIRKVQEKARQTGEAFRPRWPMIILRSPKGWTAPREVDGHYLEGFWRAHQIPLTDVATNVAHLRLLESWMRSYKPEERFDEQGRLIPELKALAPKGNRRMSANPVANGGLLRQPLDMPDFRKYAVEVKKAATSSAGNVPTVGKFLRDVMRLNLRNFRVFGPDETQSNRLEAIYEVAKKVWLAEYFPEDTDGGELALQGRVMEMLSEHTVEGWLEGYILSGRHGFINSYEPFIHVIDSMFNQHAKWLEKCNELPWRANVASLNLLITALVWRQDHNGFTHQDPGFLDVVANKSPSVVRIYLPPDAGTGKGRREAQNVRPYHAVVCRRPCPISIGRHRRSGVDQLVPKPVAARANRPAVERPSRTFARISPQLEADIAESPAATSTTVITCGRNPDGRVTRAASAPGLPNSQLGDDLGFCRAGASAVDAYLVIASARFALKLSGNSPGNPAFR